MSEEERKLFLAGKGCPSCKGKPIYDCELESTAFDGKVDCSFFECSKCKNEGKCDHKVRRGHYDGNADEQFLFELTDNTDEDPLELFGGFRCGGLLDVRD